MASSRVYEAEPGTSRLIGRLDIHIPLPAEAEDELDTPSRDTEAGS
jgi:hypothetical protein